MIRTSKASQARIIPKDKARLALVRKSLETARQEGYVMCGLIVIEGRGINTK